MGVSAWYTEYPRPRVNKIDIAAGYSHNYYNENMESSNLVSHTQDLRDIFHDRNNYAIGATYFHQFNRNHSLETGYSLSGLDINDIQESSSYPTDDFRYKEITNSIFAQWEAVISRVFSFKIGVRAEHLHLSGMQSYDNSNFTHNYFNIFPSAAVSFNIPRGNQSASLNISRKITPPMYLSLNPFIIWSSENSYSVGNPNLTPSYSWNFDLTYSFLDNWVFSFQYINAPNMMASYLYAKDGYTVSSSKNMSKHDYIYANLQYARSFWERFRLNVNIGIRHTSQAGVIEGTDLSDKSTSFLMSIRPLLVISKKYAWRIAAVFRYTSPESGLTSDKRPIYNLAAETSKEFSNGMKLVFSCSNILVNRSPSTFTSDTYSYRLRMHIPVRFSLSFSYVFGNKKVRGAEERNIEIK